jgi:hypothetical protein
MIWLASVERRRSASFSASNAWRAAVWADPSAISRIASRNTAATMRASWLLSALPARQAVEKCRVDFQKRLGGQGALAAGHRLPLPLLASRVARSRVSAAQVR